MKKVVIVSLVCLALATSSFASVPVSMGFRGGLGTGISGGIAFGLGGNYKIDTGGSATELGINLYGNNFNEESSNGFNTYTEKTNLLVFGFLANYLLNYSLANPGLFFVAGAGLAGINVSWREESATDTSLGTLLPGGGSYQEADGFAGGSVLNAGIGYLFANGFDMRFEIPTILVFGGPGSSASVVPTFTFTGGYSFQ